MSTADLEVHVNSGEDFGLSLGTLRLQLRRAAAHVLARFLQNCHDIIGRTATEPHEHEFHGACAAALATGIDRSVHWDFGAGVGDRAKVDMIDPVYRCSHESLAHPMGSAHLIPDRYHLGAEVLEP